MEHFIITGTSRGIGEALATVLVERGAAVVGISRSERERGGTFTHISGDLASIESLSGIMERALNALNDVPADSITLINNAGVLEPIGFLVELDPRALDAFFRVNLTAAVALTALFLRATREFSGMRRVLNITSGAASNPYPGWSGYCTSKAGVNMMTRVAAEEEGDRARIIAVSPGTVETGMQAAIRNVDESRFPNKERFVQLKNEGKLSTPINAAKKILRALDDPGIRSGDIVDVRKLYPRDS